jgi:hypothetical protein
VDAPRNRPFGTILGLADVEDRYWMVFREHRSQLIDVDGGSR